MLLNVKQRLLLLNILPSEGTYDVLKIVRDQQALLSFTEEEHMRFKIKRQGEMFAWDESADVPMEIRIGEVAATVIKRALRQLNEEGQLKMEFLPLYEHFVEGEDWALDSDAAKATSENGAEPTPIRPDEVVEPRPTSEVIGSRPSAEGAEPKA